MIPTLTAGVTRRAVAPVVLSLALAGALAACGGGSSTASPSSSSTTTPIGASPTGSSPAGSSLSSFRSCLTSHGVPASAAGSLFGRRRPTGSSSSSSTTPSSTPRPTIPAQYQAAFNACRSLLPSGPFGGAGAGGGFNSARFAAYRNCLEVNGVTFPSTTTTPGQSQQPGGFSGGGAFAQLRNNPKYAAAEKACANLLPTRSTTTTTVAS